MIANVALFVETIVKSRDKQRVLRKSNVGTAQQMERWTKRLSIVVRKRI